jgi:Rrf2 family protein
LNKSIYSLLDLPSKVEYALLALLEMAMRFNQQTPLTVSEITARQPIPERYLEQILGTLRRGGLLKSQRGFGGGYLLARDPSQISLLDIVTLIEGERKAEQQGEFPTIEVRLIREGWQQANIAAQTVLAQCSLADLCKQRQQYLQTSLMYYI